MKQTIRYLLGLLLAAVLLFAAGCSTEIQESEIPLPDEAPSYEYTETVVLFQEPEGEHYQSVGWETKIGTTTVQITEDISEEKRDAIITEITRILELCKKQLGETRTQCTIKIREGSYTPWSYDHILYIGYENLNTQEFTVGLGQMLFGHEVNYGLCYGFGVALAQEAGYPVDDIAVTVAQALTLCKTSPYHLDLNYACFVPDYADEETLPKVKALAVDFYQSLTQEAKRDLTENFTNALFRQYLNEYLAEHGQESYTNSDLDGIYFYPCGDELRLVWEDPYAVFYLFDYYTVRYNPYDLLNGVDDFLNSCYENFRYIAACYQLQAEEMERTAGCLEIAGKENKVSVLFVRDAAEELRGAATFNYQDNKIRMFSYHAYQHEYVHYLTRASAATVAWKYELFTAYFTERPGDPRIYWPNLLNRDTFESADPSQPRAAKLIEFANKVYESLDHPFDWSNREDCEYFNHAYIVAFDRFYNVKSDADIAPQTSFVNYLVDLVGEEAALLAIYYDDPVPTFGKNWDALISDWQTDVTEEYSWAM